MPFSLSLALSLMILIADILKSLDWLVASLLEKTYARSNDLKKSGATPFAVRNEIQVFYAQNLSIAYGQVSKLCSDIDSWNQNLILLFHSTENNFRCSFEIYLGTG